MPVAIDTSVLIEAERLGGLDDLLPRSELGPYYIPAFAASEFLIGVHPPVKDALRYRALLIYQNIFKRMVSVFNEADAAELAALSSALKRTGQQMKFYDAGIAATVMARGDKLLTSDDDFDRLAKKITILKI